MRLATKVYEQAAKTQEATKTEETSTNDKKDDVEEANYEEK